MCGSSPLDSSSSGSAQKTQVVPCPRELRVAAIRRLHDTLPMEQRGVLTEVLGNIDPANEGAWAGLLIATPGGTPPSELAAVDGVVWVQRASGNTAVVWAPPGDGEIPHALIRAAAAFVDAERIPLAQMVVGEHDGYCEALNERCGFPKFAALRYLFAEVVKLPPAAEDGVLQAGEAHERGELLFVPGAGDEPQRLGALLEQTYIGTLDCPALDGVRPMDEVLTGYRGHGRYSPGDWYFMRKGGGDVGALILAEHPGFGNWELVYMGVIPDARGRRYGEQAVYFALEIAARRGAERLVLAVDENNTPALGAYARAGFAAWDRRLVYARLRTAAQHSANAELPNA